MDPEFLLIKKMKKGDEESFEIFIRKYYGDILAYCGHHCGDRQYAEDIAQETFLRFFAGLSRYSHRGKSKNYLYTVAGNLCRDFYRKKREFPQDDLPKKGEGLTGPGEADPEKDRLMSLKEAVDRLPPELKDAVILRYFQDLKIKDTAKALGITTSLAKYRLEKAKKQLKDFMEKEDAL